MKIYSFIRNWPEAAAEPGWIISPDSVMLHTDRPTFLPEMAEDFEVLPSLCLKVGRLGKCVATRFAHRYVAGIAPAVHILPRRAVEAIAAGGFPDPQDTCWDGTLLIGDMIPLTEGGLEDDHAVNLTIRNADGSLAIMEIHTSASPLGAAEAIASASRYNTIKTGDLILTGLPPGGLHAFPGQQLICRLDGAQLLESRIK